MSTPETLPPHFPYSPDQIAKPGYWVGIQDPFAPQLSVELSLTREELEKAETADLPVKLHFRSRTADMEDEEPDDDEGEREVYIRGLSVNPDGTLKFFAYIEEGENVYSRDIWVWDYLPDVGFGAADFCVDD